MSSCALPLVPWPCGCACAAAALPLLLVDTRGGYPWRIAPSARVLGLSILIVLSSLMCHLSFFPCHLLCRLMRSSLARYLVFVPCVAESPALISQDFRCTGASPMYVSMARIIDSGFPLHSAWASPLSKGLGPASPLCRLHPIWLLARRPSPTRRSPSAVCVPAPAPLPLVSAAPQSSSRPRVGSGSHRVLDPLVRSA